MPDRDQVITNNTRPAVVLTDNHTKLNIAYNAGIAPVIQSEEYKKLIEKYEQTGIMPRRLRVAGIVIDSNMNINRWMIPKDELEAIASQLKGIQIRKDHSEKVDDVIGIVKDAWVEDDKVFYVGEISDESIIQKILLGYIKYDSIAVLANNAFCAHCMGEGKSEESSRVEALDKPHTCGLLELIIKGAKAVELSIVSLPAYTIAQFVPVGFKASVDLALQQRFANMPIPTILKADEGFKYKEDGKKEYVSAGESSSAQGSSFSGQENIINPIKANLEMSTAAQAEIQSPKLVSYDEMMKGLESVISPLTKWAEGSYKIMLEESESRKKKDEEEVKKRASIQAKLEELRKVHADEEVVKVEAAAKAAALKAQAAHDATSDEVKRKVEEMKSKIAEVRAKVEDARKQRESLTSKMEASTVGRAQVGETKEEKSPIALGMPDGTMPEYWKEILGASGRFQNMGLLTSS